MTASKSEIWHGTKFNLKIGDLFMYAISDISTFYCPKANEYRAAEKEVYEFADKLAKEKGYTNYNVWTLKVYGWRWNIEITNKD